MVIVLDCDNVVSEFEISSCTHLDFQTNAPWEKVRNPLFPSYG